MRYVYTISTEICWKKEQGNEYSEDTNTNNYRNCIHDKHLKDKNNTNEK